MPSTKVVRAFLQRLAKLNAPQGGKISPSGESADSHVTAHEQDEQSDEAARTVESGLIQRKF